MFTAINKNTKERVNSWAVFKNPTYLQEENNKWLADPNCLNEEEYYNFRRNNPEIELAVHYVKEKDCISCKGKPFRVLPCFHFYPGIKEKYGLNYVPESKEHKLVKKWVEDNLIYNENITLKYSSLTKPFRFNNSIKLSELPIDYNKAGVESTAKSIDSIRIDILLPFYKKHELFGEGIAFEVQFSKQREDTKFNRTMQRIYNGFSVVWLHEQDFDYITDDEIKLKIDEVKIYPFYSLLNYGNKQYIKNLRLEVEKLSTLLDNKSIEIINSIEDNERLKIEDYI